MIANTDLKVGCAADDCDGDTFRLHTEVRLEGILVVLYATCTKCGRKDPVPRIG